MFCKAEFYFALKRKNLLLVLLFEGTLFLENWAKCNCFTKWSSYVNWSCGQHSWNVVCLTFIMEIRLRTVNLYHLFTTALNKSRQKKNKCVKKEKKSSIYARWRFWDLMNYSCLFSCNIFQAGKENWSFNLNSLCIHQWQMSRYYTYAFLDLTPWKT